MNKKDLTKRTGYGTPAKDIIWHPKALDEIKCFPKDAKIKIGFQLRTLQQGRIIEMPHSKPMNTIASGVYELRVKVKDGIYRVFYYVKVADGIYVFHAFQKKTQKTPLAEIKIAQKRLKELMEN